MRERSRADQTAAVWGAMNPAERAMDGLLRDSHLAAPHRLPALVAEHARAMGVHDAVIYLADLQGALLVPFLGAAGPEGDTQPVPLPVDTTLAGLVFQRSDVLSQRDAHPGGDLGQQPGGRGVRLWLPLINGTERIGVLGVILDEERGRHDPLLRLRLWRFAALVAEIVVTKNAYGDSIVRTRRQARMGLAAEIQWGVLPPLTFACRDVVVAGALEPAYEVAGDSVDYAVDATTTKFAIFDGMGHGLQSAQLAALAVASYRNGRRTGLSLTGTAQGIDAAVESVFAGNSFTTAVLAELDTDSGMLTWINAGHPEPLLLRAGRIVRALHVEPGLPFGLGLTDGPGPYPVGSERLQPGDQVLLFTDGVVEARSPQGEFFGLGRLVDLIARHEAAALSLPETLRRIVRELLEHQQGQLDDDASMLLVQYRGGGQDHLLPDDVAILHGH